MGYQLLFHKNGIRDEHVFVLEKNYSIIANINTTLVLVTIAANKKNLFCFLQMQLCNAFDIEMSKNLSNTTIDKMWLIKAVLFYMPIDYFIVHCIALMHCLRLYAFRVIGIPYAVRVLLGSVWLIDSLLHSRSSGISDPLFICWCKTFKYSMLFIWALRTSRWKLKFYPGSVQIKVVWYCCLVFIFFQRQYL